MSNNLNLAISDVYYTSHGGLFKPNFQELMIDLFEIEGRGDGFLSKDYQSSVLRPLIQFLEKLGPEKFETLFNGKEEDLSIQQKNQRKSIEEISECLMQRSNDFKYYKSSFKDLQAFQAIVDTIFENVMQNADGRISHQVLPPLAKWGRHKSPFAVSQFSPRLKKIGIQAGIISMPHEHRTGGLLAWAALGHEVAGHHFLHAVDGLMRDLVDALRKKFEEVAAQKELKDEDLSSFQSLSDYWCACIEETACDVLGILNLGPAFGIGFIGYLRGVQGGKLESSGVLYSTKKAGTNSLILESEETSQIFVEKLSGNIIFKKSKGMIGKKGNKKPLMYERFNSADNHPLDVLRAFVFTKIIRKIVPDSSLIGLIEEEAFQDFEHEDSIELFSLEKNKSVYKVDSQVFPKELAIETAGIAAEVIASSQLDSLESKSLLDIFTWNEEDEARVEVFRRIIEQSEPENLLTSSNEEFFARHIVAASVLSCIFGKPEEKEGLKIHLIEEVFNKMKSVLSTAYAKNMSLRVGEYLKRDSSMDSLDEEDPIPDES